MTGLFRRIRPRNEDGFTLVELLIAMIVLTIGILALVSAYTSGFAAMSRATRLSSATLLADTQMERYRALSYSNIGLSTTCGSSCTPDSTYTSDPAYDATDRVTTGCTTTDSTCLSIQTKTGPDGQSYRMETFIEYACVTGDYTLDVSALTCTVTATGAAGPSPVKRVTVVVTSTGGTGLGGGAISIREQSSFTKITGL